MKRILRHTLIYGLGFVGTSALALLLTPLYTRYIPPEGYGRLRLVSITLQILTIVGSLGVVEAFYRFFYQLAAEDKKRQIVATCFICLTVPLALGGMALFAAAPFMAEWLLDSAEEARLFRVAAGTMLAGGVSTFFLAYLRAEERSGLYALLSVLQLALSLGLNILFVVHIGWGVFGVLLAALFSQLAVALTLTPVVARQAIGQLDRDILRKVLRFGLPLMPANVAGYLIGSSNLYFLKTFGTLAEVGIFSLALQFGSAINLLVVTPFDMTWAPMKYKLASDPQADRIYGNVLTYFVFVALFACIGLAALIGDTLAILVDARYQDATLYVGAIGLSWAIFGAYRVFCFGIDITNKTHWRLLIILFTLLINAGLNITLIPIIGTWGAVAGLLGAYTFMAASAYFVSQRLFPVTYQVGRITKLAVAAFVCAAAAGSIETGSHILNLLAKTAIVLTYPALLVPLRFYGEDEKRKLRELWNRVTRKQAGTP